MHFVTVYFDGEGPNREDRYSILLPCVWKESGLSDTIFRKLMDNYGESCFDIDEVFDEIEGDPSENLIVLLEEDDLERVKSKILRFILNMEFLLEWLFGSDELDEIVAFATNGEYTSYLEYKLEKQEASTADFYIGNIGGRFVYRYRNTLRFDLCYPFYDGGKRPLNPIAFNQACLAILQEEDVADVPPSVPAFLNWFTENCMEFEDWFDAIGEDEFDAYWNNAKDRRVIELLRRFPRGKHEWLMVSRTDRFKKMGVSAKMLDDLVTPTKDLLFKSGGRHGGKRSGTFHLALKNRIDGAGDCDGLFAGLKTLIAEWVKSKDESKKLTDLIDHYR